MVLLTCFVSHIRLAIENLICPGHLQLNCIGVYLLIHVGCVTLFSHCLLCPAHSYGENTFASFCLSSVGWISAFGLSGLSVGPGKSMAVIISGLLQVARSHVAICVSIGYVNEIRLFSNCCFSGVTVSRVFLKFVSFSSGDDAFFFLLSVWMSISSSPRSLNSAANLLGVLTSLAVLLLWRRDF